MIISCKDTKEKIQTKDFCRKNIIFLYFLHKNTTYPQTPQPYRRMFFSELRLYLEVQLPPCEIVRHSVLVVCHIRNPII